VFSGSFACSFGNAVVDQFFTPFTPPAGLTASASFAFFDGIYDVDFSFNPADDFEPPVGFAYRFTLADQAEQVVAAALDVNGNGVRPRPTQTSPGQYAGIANIYDPSDLVNPLLQLTSIDGVRDPAGVGFTPFSPRNSIVVVQAVGTDPQLPSGIRPTINNVSNQFIAETQSVPGPLPVLGVAAMFAQARRLRRRIAG
jgi:hypothetical protein